MGQGSIGSMSPVLASFDAATGIGRLTLNRPDVLNALDVPMARAFHSAVDELTRTAGLRVIVIAGAGKVFAAGGDVPSFLAEGIDGASAVIEALLDSLNPAIVALRQHPAPVITAVRGVAAGAGLSLAISGDVVVADEKSRFVIAYDRIGASPDCGLTWFLPRRVGRGLAFQMMFVSRTLAAHEALSHGLIDHMVPASEFDQAVAELASTIASGPTSAFGAYKRLLDGGDGLIEQLEAERRSLIASTATSDFAEGVTAFTAKRTAKFVGT